MRFYTNSHRHVCGIDLHTKMMHVCILDVDGDILIHKNISTNAKALLRLIEPYREDIIIGVECMFSWYWLADLCAKEGIEFILGLANHSLLPPELKQCPRHIGRNLTQQIGSSR